MLDAKALSETCADHHVFRQNGFVALTVRMIVGVDRIARCRYRHS
jgi:hypothetical protein